MEKGLYHFIRRDAKPVGNTFHPHVAHFSRIEQDPRLKTMGYGRRFLASLPPAPVTHDIGDIARFFAAAPDGRA